MSRKRFAALGAAAVATLALGNVSGVAAAAPVDLVTNGGFETPALGWGSWNVFSSIPGWSVASGCGIEIQNHVAGSPFEGRQYTELDSNCPSAISQVLTTEPGRYYTLSYAFSARPGVNAADNVLRPSWDGTPLTARTADGLGLSDTSWTVHTEKVKATGSATSLVFADGGTRNGVGTYLDAVSVTGALPEGIGDCKKGDWKRYVDDGGAPFKNQGDCVSFVATEESNRADG